MSIMDTVLNAINYQLVLELPWIVKGPGIVLIAWFLLRGVTRFITLRPIKGLTNLVYAFIIALVLSRYGNDIALMIQGAPPVSQ